MNSAGPSNAVCPGWMKTEMDVADQAGASYSDADIEGVNLMTPVCKFWGYRSGDSVSGESGAGS